MYVSIRNIFLSIKEIKMKDKENAESQMQTGIKPKYKIKQNGKRSRAFSSNEREEK